MNGRNKRGEAYHRIVVFTPYPWNHALTVLRVSGPLSESGIEMVPGENQPERVRLGDAVLIQRDFPKFIPLYGEIVARATAEGKPIIYEIDDLLFQLPEEHPYAAARFFMPALLPMLHAVLRADLVTTPTAKLRDCLLPMNPNTVVLPNCLNDRIWPSEAIPRRDQAEEVVVGYMGSDSHLPDLEQIAPVLFKVLNRFGTNISMKFWGVQPPALIRSHPKVEWIPLAVADYSEFAAYFYQEQSDIFIAPLADSLFNRCKSPIKFLEYSWMGVPGVYSRLDPYEGVVEHGRNGFLASTPEEWEKCISQLILDPSLRNEIGMRAKQTVSENWLLSARSPEWKRMYRAASAPPVSRKGKSQRMDQQRIAILGVIEKAGKWQEELQEKVESLEKSLAEEKRRAQALSDTIDEIRAGDAWKIVTWLWSIRLALAPKGSGRERLARRITKLLRKP